MNLKPRGGVPPRPYDGVMKADPGDPGCGQKALVITQPGGGELIVCPHCDGPVARAILERGAA